MVSLDSTLLSAHDYGGSGISIVLSEMDETLVGSPFQEIPFLSDSTVILLPLIKL